MSFYARGAVAKENRDTMQQHVRRTGRSAFAFAGTGLLPGE
jgi:hypothetical protein